MTTVVVASGTTWLVPADWSATNTIVCIGAGGNGGASVNGVSNGGGGGGGACAFSSNIPLVPGAIVAIQIGVAGGSTGSGLVPTANTWFGPSTIIAAGGSSGVTNTAGVAGSTANSVGGTKYAGGGSINWSGSNGGTGGGGAAGTTGAGAASGALNAAGSTGGTGDATTGGTGGTASSGTGGSGSEIAGGVGSGGGGGGGNDSGNNPGGTAGSYGGGGGGGATASTGLSPAGGPGAPGVIIITYTSTPDVGQDTWPASTTDTPAFIAHKINPHLMADRNYDDTGAMQYASNTLSVVNTFVFDADGGPLPLKSQYVEAASQRYNALYGTAYDDTGARAWAAFVVTAPTPKLWYAPGITDILPLQGYVERQTQLFSLLRGQAYDDTGARAWAAFIYPPSTPKPSFGADGGLLPIGQYVEAQTQRFSMLRGQAYDDAGARYYAASIIAVTPATLFSADGSMMPQDSLGTMARLIRFGSLYNTVVFNRPPVYRGLILIPNIFFVAGNELISDLNATINVINYDLQILNIPRSYFLPLFKDLHPNGFADTLNVLVKLWNALPPPINSVTIPHVKLFLSVGAPELTLAVNTLIDEMNVFIIALQAYT